MTIEALYKLFLEYPQITTDSRVVSKDGLFFALKGENFDGNIFAQKAIENGCAYAIIDNPDYKKGDQFIVVQNVLSSLQQLAYHHRKQMNLPVIGITGSNGKTTTKELLASILSHKFNISYTQGNLNNHIGVPLTILSFNKDTELGIVEMGANHTGEIKDLCEISCPDYGIITNIGRAHLEGFGSFENIIKAKSELYDYLAQTNGKVFYNANDKLLSSLVSEKRIDSITYGNKEISKAYGEVIKDGIFFKLKAVVEEKSYTIETRLVGDYNLDNIIAALAIGHYFKIDENLMVKAIENYKPENNRSQFIKTDYNQIFLDAYNANPTSVKAAINNFEQLDLPKKSLILGDMFELGDDAINDHYDVIKIVENKNYDQIILVGEIFAGLKLNNSMMQFKNVVLLKEWLNKNPIKQSNILIKGSRGNQLERIVEFL